MTSYKKVILEALRTGRRLLRFRLQMISTYFSKDNFDNLPQVLCVGVPKAATTWLYARLNLHPQVLLPRGKELHFFYELYSVKTSNPKFDHTKTSLFWHFEFNLKSKTHWRWYARQFAGGENKVRIDITPTYCRVSRGRIATIKKKIPNAKIILIIRNPIDRAWSGACYFMDRFHGKTLDQLDMETELKPWVFESERLDYGNYIDMLKNWDKHYQENQNIKYILYDDIQEKPREILRDVCDFLQIDPNLLPPPKNDKKTVNSSYRKVIIPLCIKQELIDLYRPQVDYLERRFSRDLSQWLE